MKTLDFVTVDVETANADLASICQIGIVTVRSGKIEEVWSQLINPEDFFDSINISIHGIDESKVHGAPTFKDVVQEAEKRLQNTVVSHTSFDKLSILRASYKYQLNLTEKNWLDSARVVRRAWPEKYAQRGYGLANVAKDLGINFNHHDAAEDAWVAAEIMLHACSKESLDIDGWFQRIKQPIFPTSPELAKPIRRDGDPDGPLFGEILVFTGALTIPRREAADLAASVGCTVESGVTKRTTLLIVGDQDARYLAGNEKSSKHRKAEALIEKGQSIRILRESDFKQLVALH